jgi:hypothetical protein
VNILYPKFAANRLPAMLRIALLGAVLAGGYGAMHDQISYTISPEYFTKLKFVQFSYANFGWPNRAYASEVGVLASWWVGLIGGWALARLGLDELPNELRRKTIAKSFSIVFTIALAGGAIGGLIGFAITRDADLSGWHEWKDVLELTDLPAFITVAYLHAGSYLGALVGVVCGAIYVRKTVRRIDSLRESV